MKEPKDMTDFELSEEIIRAEGREDAYLTGYNLKKRVMEKATLAYNRAHQTWCKASNWHRELRNERDSRRTTPPPLPSKETR